MKIVVLYDQIPENAPKDEQDVLVQKKAVFEALLDLGHEPIALGFSLDFKDIIAQLRRADPDLVFNLVESVNGKGQMIYTAPAMLDYLGLPYTGSKTESLFLTSNKLLAKKILKASNVPTPPWVCLENIQNENIPTNAPYIIKSVWEHASMGIDDSSIITPQQHHQLVEMIDYKREKLGGDCFAELYITGREFNLSLLAGSGEPEVLPVAEIKFIDYPDNKIKIVDYKAKWQEDSFEYLHTKRSFDFKDIDLPLLNKLEKIAKECWGIFSLRGYARVDFRVDEYGQPWILEINANPCIAPDSGFVAAGKETGLLFHQVVERILKASNTR